MFVNCSHTFCFYPVVPSAPILQLEPLNCTSIVAHWQTSSDSVAVQGYQLCYHEEGQPEQPIIQLKAQTFTHTISGLGELHTSPLRVAFCRMIGRSSNRKTQNAQGSDHEVHTQLGLAENDLIQGAVGL